MSDGTDTMRDSISFYYQDVLCTINENPIKLWLANIISENEKNLGEISIIFCTDDDLLLVNQQYLDHDYYTDIITFDYCEEDTISGDLFISIDRVTDNADQLSISREVELHRVIVHGILHLLGYKDKTDLDQELIRQKEDYYLTKIFSNLTLESTKSKTN